ncbi:MAG: NAD(P)/FAD-dependent oxidoreductase [Bacillota bacterium]
MSARKRIVIIGAGPAGLTAGYEILRQLPDCEVIILEESEVVGGISKTVNYKGNRIDIGGHRFFSKSDKIMNWWMSLMPVQGADALDDKILERKKMLNPGGPDPESTDCVMLVRDRVSRIYYLNKFFDYPISLKPQVFINLGPARTLKAGCSYIRSVIFKRTENSLEDFMINRFGHTLYSMFFENYTQKVWGMHPSDISPDWGAQRIRGLSLSKVVLDYVNKLSRKKGDIKQKNKETSLIEQFIYPKYGPGQLWEIVAERIRKMGGKIYNNCRVLKINAEERMVNSVVYEYQRQIHLLKGEIFFSSMPIKDLVSGIIGVQVPYEVKVVADGLQYRDFITVGLLVKKLNLKNETSIRTIGNIVPDCWIYIQEPDIKVGRLQIFNNWSPYMLNDVENTVWIGCEYFCNEGDDMWNMSDGEFISFAIDEFSKMGIIDKMDVLDAMRIKVKKAYPAYFGTYKELSKVREFLNNFQNLYCIGRNGQHRYNNMDHSMLTAMEAVNNILLGIKNKDNVWSV